jgi:hypothetical protein
MPSCRARKRMDATGCLPPESSAAMSNSNPTGSPRGSLGLLLRNRHPRTIANATGLPRGWLRLQPRRDLS